MAGATDVLGPDGINQIWLDATRKVGDPGYVKHPQITWYDGHPVMGKGFAAARGWSPKKTGCYVAVSREEAMGASVRSLS